MITALFTTIVLGFEAYIGTKYFNGERLSQMYVVDYITEYARLVESNYMENLYHDYAVICKGQVEAFVATGQRMSLDSIADICNTARAEMIRQNGIHNLSDITLNKQMIMDYRTFISGVQVGCVMVATVGVIVIAKHYKIF
jgi:hypothetical protein